LRIQPVQSLDAPELALYLTLRRVEEHERAGVLAATNIEVVKRLLATDMDLLRQYAGRNSAAAFTFPKII
jgi:hypothetical protein